MTENGKRVHFIAIGGSVMHNLALALHRDGWHVSGSDDKIFDPAKGKLEKEGLMPAETGWFPDRVSKDLDGIVLGMHAKKDNPELLKAQELNIPIYSFPEFVRSFSEDKQRIVIGGSHGKTTITAMIMHVLKSIGKPFDYLVGADLDGFDLTVKLSGDAPIIIIEGDEYFASALQPQPKINLYGHHIGLISGVKWDHINVFPSIDDYVQAFEKFADASPKGGTIIFNSEDDIATLIGRKEREDVSMLEYSMHPARIDNGITYLITKEFGDLALKIFGDHNLSNLSAAKTVCGQLGIEDMDFYKAIRNFKGAKRRLEKIQTKDGNLVFKDYAHSPSKLLATTKAVKKQFPDKKLIACLELHTFSSLDPEFLNQYHKSFQAADSALVYVDPEVLKSKGESGLNPDFIKKAFGNPELKVFTNPEDLQDFFSSNDLVDSNILLMSSGNFSGIDLKVL